MSDKKEEVVEKKEEEAKKEFHFPHLKKTVIASTLEEATELVNKK